MTEQNLQHKSSVVDNPVLAEFCDRWATKYARAYDLSNPSDQADFYEGVLEMARQMAVGSKTGDLYLSVCPEGPCSLKVSVSPQSA